MAVNFNLLAREGPSGLYQGFEQGQRIATENALAQQKLAQERELSMLRGMELRGNIRAQEEKRAQDARVLRASQYREQLLRAPTSEAMRNIIRQQHADPILGPTLKQFGSLEQDLADVPDDPTKLEDYRRREAMGLSKWIESRGEIADISRIMGGGAAAAPAAAPTVAPMAAPMVAPSAAPAAGELVAPPIRGPVGVMREIAPGGAAGPEVPMAAAPMANALPATVGVAAPPVTAPTTNALVAPAAAATPDAIAAAPAPDLVAMRRKRDALLALGTPRAKALAEGVSADIRSAESATPPDAKMMRILGIPTTKAGFTEFERLKQNPGEFARTLDRLDLPPAERRSLELAYARKLSTHAPAPSATIIQEKAESGEYGKLLVGEYKAISNAAALASKSLPALETQAKILDQGFTTGFGTDAKTAAASVLASLGVPEADKFATNSQTFLAATQQAVLQRQLEQKGPQTESDAQRITQTAAQRGNTVDANRFLIDVARAQLKRDIEQRNFYASWREKNKTFSGAEDAWYAGDGGKSLFDRPELKKYAAPAGAAAPAAAPATAIPQAAINDLKAGRGTDAQFDAIFGAGAAKRAREGK